MLLARATIFCVLGSITVAAGHAQQRTSTIQSSRTNTTREDEVAALRDDINKMKVLVQQMESNLAFVDTTQSPIKHQFQLEIDMWKTVIQQMERRLDRAGPH